MLKRAAFKTIAKRTVKFGKRAHHGVNPKRAHGKTCLHGLICDEFFLVLFESHLHLVAVFTNVHHG